MVIANLDVKRPVVFLRPLKTDSPLLVDANAELSLPVPAQCFKAIAGQQHQVYPVDGRLRKVQSPLRLLFERLKLFDSLA